MELSPEEVASLPDGKSYSLAVFSMVQETNTQTPTHTHSQKEELEAVCLSIFSKEQAQLTWDKEKEKGVTLSSPQVWTEWII